MRNIFFTLLFLLAGFSGKAQTPTLIYSASFTASGSGASGVPTVNVNIPAGSNRVMFVRYYMERNHGTTTPNSNWPSNPDGTAYTALTSGLIEIEGILCTYIDSRTTFYHTPNTGDTRFSTHYSVRELADNQGLPTGSATITFPGLNLPENAGDEMVVAVSVFENARPGVHIVNSNRFTSFNSSSFTVSGTSPTPATGSVPTAPPGSTASNIIYLTDGTYSQQGAALTFSSGWTSLANLSVNNTSGTTLPGTGYSNEQDGIRFLSIYRSGVAGTPTVTITRSGSTTIHRAAGYMYAILPLARPSVTGTVYRDNNGLTGGINNGGTGGGVWNTASTLWVNAVRYGNVIATAPVNASGVFTFAAGGAIIENDVVTFQLSNTQGTVNNPPPAMALPNGWVTVGESTTSGPSDGTPDGQFTLTIGNANSPNNTTNRFGVTLATDIQVNKSGPLSVAPNGSITYKIYVTNNGPGLATNVVVQDPAVSNFTATGITCEAGPGNGGSASCPASVTVAGLQGAGLIIPSLPDGSAVVFTITGNASASGTITNTASATATLDTNPSNNSSTVITRIEDNASCLQTTYTLNLAQTASTNSVVANGGTINLVYTLSSGTAITGLGSSFTIPVAYSDLINNNGAVDNRWFSLVNETTGTGIGLNLGMATYNNGSASQTLQTGSVFGSLPTNNIKPSPGLYNNYPGILNIDGSLTGALQTGSLNPLGTFTLSFGNVTMPSGVRIVSESLILQGRGSANTSAANASYIASSYFAKPLIQHGTISGNQSVTLDTEMELGQTYGFRYTAFYTTGILRVGVQRGVVFKSGSITFAYNCCEAGTTAPPVLATMANSCPETTVDLGDAHTGAVPAGVALRWYTTADRSTPVLTGTQVTEAGTGTYYAFYYDSTNECYSPASDAVTVIIEDCDPCAITATNPDSDGDGISDYCDLDDDNDGILDTAENECLNIIFFTYPASIPVISTEDFGYSFTGTAQNNLNLTADLSHKFGYPANSGAVIVTLTNAHVHPNYNEFYVRGDLPVTRWEITGSVASVVGIEHGMQYFPGQRRTINLLDNVQTPIYQTPSDANWNSGSSGNTYYLENLTGSMRTDGILHHGVVEYTMTKKFELSTNESGPSRWSTYFVRIYPECDTDKDGIPNRLDLDSDNDGCPDAIEGDENVTNAQLVNAGGILKGGNGINPVVVPSSGTYNKSVLLNLCPDGSCVDVDGVPTVVNSGGAADVGGDVGQGIGSSQNAAVNGCHCIKPGASGTPDGYTKVGITVQQKQETWPENIPNGHIALESQTKGMVITRVNHVSTIPDPEEDSVTDPKAGMLVYDIVDECVKLFNGTTWNCIQRSCNDL